MITCYHHIRDDLHKPHSRSRGINCCYNKALVGTTDFLDFSTWITRSGKIGCVSLPFTMTAIPDYVKIDERITNLTWSTFDEMSRWENLHKTYTDESRVDTKFTQEDRERDTDDMIANTLGYSWRWKFSRIFGLPLTGQSLRKTTHKWGEKGFDISLPSASSVASS